MRHVSHPDLHFYQVSSKDFKGHSSYRVDKKFYAYMTPTGSVQKQYVPHFGGSGGGQEWGWGGGGGGHNTDWTLKKISQNNVKKVEKLIKNDGRITPKAHAQLQTMTKTPAKF